MLEWFCKNRAERQILKSDRALPSGCRTSRMTQKFDGVDSDGDKRYGLHFPLLYVMPDIKLSCIFQATALF